MTDPNGPLNMAATGLFWTAGIAVCVGIGKAIDRFSKLHLRRHVSRALGNGDARVRDFAEEFARWEAEQAALSRRTR